VPHLLVDSAVPGPAVLEAMGVSDLGYGERSGGEMRLFVADMQGKRQRLYVEGKTFTVHSFTLSVDTNQCIGDEDGLDYDNGGRSLALELGEDVPQEWITDYGGGLRDVLLVINPKGTYDSFPCAVVGIRSLRSKLAYAGDLHKVAAGLEVLACTLDGLKEKLTF
jgi:hypothetical protein